MESPRSPSYSSQESCASGSEVDQHSFGDNSDAEQTDDGQVQVENSSPLHGHAAATAIRTPTTHARKFDRQGKQTPRIRSRSSTPSSRSTSITPSSRSIVTTPRNIQKEDCNCQAVLLKKIKDLEQQNQLILEKLDMVLSAPRNSKLKKVGVPAHIKAAVHDGYKCGVEEKSLKWVHKDISGKCLKYNSTENKKTTDQVVTFTKGMYPTAEEGVIHAAVERYFESVRQRDLKEASGKAELHRRKMTLYNRRKRKLGFRKTALKAKRSYNEEKKKEIMSTLTIEFMSSEEENESDEDSFVIKALPWRSDEMKKIVYELDDKWMTLQSSKSRKQTSKRIRLETAVSSHGPPSNSENLGWALK